QLTGALAAAIDGRPLGDTPLGRALGAEATLDARFTVEQNGNVAAEDLQLRAAQLTIAGDARLTGGGEQVEAKLDFEVPDLAPASALADAPLAGELSGTVAARGPLDNPVIDLSYAGRDLSYDGTAAIGAVSGEATARDPFGTASVELSITGNDLRYEANT